MLQELSTKLVMIHIALHPQWTSKVFLELLNTKHIMWSPWNMTTKQDSLLKVSQTEAMTVLLALTIILAVALGKPGTAISKWKNDRIHSHLRGKHEWKKKTWGPHNKGCVCLKRNMLPCHREIGDSTIHKASYVFWRWLIKTNTTYLGFDISRPQGHLTPPIRCIWHVDRLLTAHNMILSCAVLSPLLPFPCFVITALPQYF